MIGRVKEYDGYFTFDRKEPQQSTLDVTLKSASIDTDVDALNAELQKDKFLNTKKFPTMHFKSTKVTVTGENTGDVTGDFTLLGVTKPVTLHVTYNKSGVHPYTNNYISGFSADATLNRSDFGMKAYVPDVGDKITIHIEAEGIDPLRHPATIKQQR
jgi:polyisoprenoid-binding protein YceI